MGSLALLLAAVLGGISALFYIAAGDNNRHIAHTWESSVCSAANTFCDHPERLALAAVGILVLALIVKFAAAVRG
jgi:hypothetical protein